MVLATNTGGHHQLGRKFGDLFGLVIIIGDHDDIVFSVGGADGGDQIAETGGFLAVDLKDGAVLIGPEQDVGEFWRML